MSEHLDFDRIGRLPLPGDNVGIAIRKLQAGTQIRFENATFSLSHTVMEGHRFALSPIPPGGHLLSWGLPFGVATRALEPGDYVCNPQILEALGLRDLDFALPDSPNFEDRIVPYALGSDFKPGEQTPRYASPGSFEGFRRSGNRGVGTRNFIVVLGTSSQTASFANQVASRFGGLADSCPNIDGIVAVAHTEGGGTDVPNNRDFLLRTLAGFAVHPNVGAVLAVDYGTEPLSNAPLKAFMRERDYPLGDVPHQFFTLSDGFQADMEHAGRILRDWLHVVNATPRTSEPLSELKIALQCGGSDAFSGISGNPLVSWVARELIRHGGSANLAETDELIGAEPYVLGNVRNVDVAARFLEKIQAYKDLATWHGTSAEGNPSGGNKYRGLYNIVLKSIGAAMKRHPEVRLDEVIDYAQPMQTPGYYFMHSPGNDLESIAGQVASGCNMIFFVTGNGSVTNFPFVPTLKVVTTTKRFELLSNDMDINAGAYLDGMPMDDLGRDMFDLTCAVASGRRSKGEVAGHAQVSIWRTWRQTSTDNLDTLHAMPKPAGEPLAVCPIAPDRALTFDGIKGPHGAVCDRVGLVLPTSLCSAQIARLAAERLTARGIGREKAVSRFVGLAHTEGCGVSGEGAERMFTRAMVGYLTHPQVHAALLLEHGCEKTHNDFIRHALRERGLPETDYGWASVQLDGGIETVLDKIEAWFTQRFAAEPEPQTQTAPISALRVGLHAAGPISDGAAESLSLFTRQLIAAGATVIVPDMATLLQHASFVSGTLLASKTPATLAYGQTPKTPGFHIMETQSDHWVESLTGLGGTGVDVIIAYTGIHPMQGHPLVPMLQLTADPNIATQFSGDIDQVLARDPQRNAQNLLDQLLAVASRTYVPVTPAHGNTDFQFTRGLLGVSM